MTVHYCLTWPCPVCYTTPSHGPVCQTCGTRYLGSHVCTRDSLEGRIQELRRLQQYLGDPPTYARDCTPGIPPGYLTDADT